MSRRVSNHSGRKHKGKGGKVFSAKHADRNYNTANDPHIDTSLSCKNTYWMNPDLGIDAPTFDQFEKQFYEKYFARHIVVTNAKHEQTRHYERMIDADKLRTSSRTAVEDTLLYFGDKKNPLPDDVRDKMVAEFVEWHKQTFPQCVVLDYATHRDEPESAVHTEMRCVWCAVHDDGHLYPNQTKALEQMGFVNNGQKHDNAKKEYTKMCRAKQAEILVAHGYAVELAPKHGKGGQTLEEFKRDRAIEERKEQEKFIVHPEDKREIESQIRPNKFNRDEVVMPKELAQKLVVSALERDRYKGEYERATERKTESIEREKMGMRLELNRQSEEIKSLQDRFRDLNNCVKQFTEERGLFHVFQQFVERYKQAKQERLRQFQREQERIKSQSQDHGHHRRR